MPYTDRNGATFDVGMTVRLRAGRYEPYSSNPCVGSSYEVTGTVSSVSSYVRADDDYGIFVDWSNGRSNEYRPSDLILDAPMPTMPIDMPKAAPAPALTTAQKLCKRADSAEFTEEYTFQDRHVNANRDARLMGLIREMKRELLRLDAIAKAGKA